MMKTGLKFSPNGGKILDGTGLAAVRKRIEEAFSHVRKDISTSEPEIEIAEEVKINIEPETGREKPLPPLAERPLAERAAPILRVAELRFQHAVGRRHHHNGVYRISGPTETAEELFDAALKALGGGR